MSDTFVSAEKELSEEQLAVLPRIQKLLQLAAKNPNAEEAASAAAKAQDLLLAYNLSADMLDEDPEGGVRMKDSYDGGLYEYQRDLWHWVSDLNFVYHWVGQRWVDGLNRRYKNAWGEWRVDKGAGRHVWKHFLIGRKRNVAATIAMATYLEQTIERVAREFAGSPSEFFTTSTHSFREGAAEAVTTKLWRRRQEYLDQERLKAAEAHEKASQATRDGASIGTALTVAEAKQSEDDANQDFRRGLPEGTTARARAEFKAQRAAQAAADAAAEAEFARWAAAHPEEAAKQEAERKAEAEKARKREEKNAARRIGRAPAMGKRQDPRAWALGHDKGKTISIDQQAEGIKSAGALG